MSRQKEVVLITGPTSGIGYALAHVVAHAGHDVVLVGRDAKKLHYLKTELEERHKVFVRTITQDLAAPHAAQHIFDACVQRDIHVTALVNNAGFGVSGDICATDANVERELIQVNAIAVSELSKIFAQSMKKKRHGKILNVASVVGFFPGPYMAVYSASKAYVLSFSEALREELRGTGVTVSVLCPGMTNTRFGENPHMNDPSFRNGMDASRVANCAYEGMMEGRRIIVPGFKNKLFVFLPRFLPRSVVAWLSGRALR